MILFISRLVRIDFKNGLRSGVWEQANGGKGVSESNKCSLIEPGHLCHDTLRERKCKSIVKIKVPNNSCCARALVTARAIVDNHPKVRSFIEGRETQRAEAFMLMNIARIEQGTACGAGELKKLMATPALQDYQLVVLHASRHYTGETYSPLREKKLFLMLKDDHYDVISNLHGFWDRRYVCGYCHQGYDHQRQHRCHANKEHCSAYLTTGCVDYLHWSNGAHRECTTCYRFFYGKTCFTNHKKTAFVDTKGEMRTCVSTCESLKLSVDCKRLLKTCL